MTTVSERGAGGARITSAPLRTTLARLLVEDAVAGVTDCAEQDFVFHVEDVCTAFGADDRSTSPPRLVEPEAQVITRSGDAGASTLIRFADRDGRQLLETWFGGRRVTSGDAAAAVDALAEAAAAEFSAGALRRFRFRLVRDLPATAHRCVGEVQQTYVRDGERRIDVALRYLGDDGVVSALAWATCADITA